VPNRKLTEAERERLRLILKDAKRRRLARVARILAAEILRDSERKGDYSR